MPGLWNAKQDRLGSSIRDGLPQRELDKRLTAVAALGLLLSSMPRADANVITVTSAGDPGADGTSLRQAVASASDGDEIEFDPSLVGNTITLAQSQVAVDKSLSIVGPGADMLTISGNNASRIFYICNQGVVIPSASINGACRG